MGLLAIFHSLAAVGALWAVWKARMVDYQGAIIVTLNIMVILLWFIIVRYKVTQG